MRVYGPAVWVRVYGPAVCSVGEGVRGSSVGEGVLFSTCVNKVLVIHPPLSLCHVHNSEGIPGITGMSVAAIFRLH